jgi:hypothetical protein
MPNRWFTPIVLPLVRRRLHLGVRETMSCADGTMSLTRLLAGLCWQELKELCPYDCVVKMEIYRACVRLADDLLRVLDHLDHSAHPIRHGGR